jgi:hypothetical protein
MLNDDEGYLASVIRLRASSIGLATSLLALGRVAKL